uniref:Adhesin domain-containing protein n=1 Tax=Sphingobacterium sp. (strain 21) TaxID=743722 RepID=F4CDL4_SPHS2
MNKLTLFFIAIYSSYFLASAQDTPSPYLTKSLRSENIRSVDLQTSGGSLTVEGVNDSEARLEVFVQGNNGNNRLSKEEIEQRLKDSYDLQISSNNGQLIAIARPKSGFKNWKKSVSISFKAYVPKAASAKLKTSGGSLSLNGINGYIEGATSGGSIKVAHVKNNVNLKTSGGSINADDVTGNLLLHTSGGSIKLSNLKGKIDARTSGGSIGANDISGELLAKTSGGSIRVDRMAGSADLATSASSTSVNMVNVDKYLKIDVSAGSVNLQLPMDKGLDLNLSAGKINLPSLNNFAGTKEKDRVVGKLNGGGADVDVHVSVGNLNLEAN